MKKREVVVIAFIPVLHRGYMEFLAQSGSKKVYLLESSDVPELPRFSREIRALHFDEISKALKAFGYEAYRFGESVTIIKESSFDLCMPDEDITRAVYAKYFHGMRVSFSNTFLRWDWSRSVGFSETLPDADRVIKIGEAEADEVLRRMQRLFEEREKSSDWWRQVAAMAVCKQGQTIVAYNRHFPNEYAPYIDGDPRNNFGPGEYIEISTALHAERGIIAEAAKNGIPLDGADMFVTTFPCSDCANQIVVSGIQKVFFTGGYSNLNGAKTLRDHGVELIYVESDAC